MRGSWFLPVASFFWGLRFFYIPILSLIIYSFNDSQLVTVWGGWVFELVGMANC